MIARASDQFVALDSRRPNKIVMGSKIKPNKEINVTKNVKYCVSNSQCNS